MRASIYRWTAGLSLLGLLALALSGVGAATAQTSAGTGTPTRTPTRTPTGTPTRVPFVPTDGPSPTATLVPGPNTYTVQYGDTLLVLARKFGLTIPILRSSNNLGSDTIYAGQVLFVPTPAPTATPSAVPIGAALYVVQPGDQLRALAHHFGVTYSALKSFNGLTSDVIRVGQVLAIPTPGPAPTQRVLTGQTYVVQLGDQLLRIARLYGVTLTALRTANGLTTDILQPGQVLVIPVPTPTRTPLAAGPTPTGSYGVYVVLPGDQLTRIAARYGITVAALRTANGLTTDILQPDQMLIIPSPTLHPILYTVTWGDNLTNLAIRFNTTVAAIKRANGLVKSDTIYRDTQLIIPVP